MASILLLNGSVPWWCFKIVTLMKGWWPLWYLLSFHTMPATAVTHQGQVQGSLGWWRWRLLCASWHPGLRDAVNSREEQGPIWNPLTDWRELSLYPVPSELPGLQKKGSFSAGKRVFKEPSDYRARMRLRCVCACVCVRAKASFCFGPCGTPCSEGSAWQVA